MNKFLSVAIDGPSGAGKSSMAKRVAKEFGFIYVDTGAIYRTVGLYCYRNGIDRKNEKEVSAAFPNIHIEIAYDDSGSQEMLLNSEDVSEAIRMPEISICASDISSLPACRAFLLEMQRKMAETNNVVMDGRDIGTVVLPHADLKIYLTASTEARAQRRLRQLQLKGIDTSFEDVLKDIEYRDYQDTHREISPLRQAPDAVLVDSSNIDSKETFQLLCELIRKNLRAELPSKEEEI